MGNLQNSRFPQLTFHKQSLWTVASGFRSKYIYSVTAVFYFMEPFSINSR